MKIGKYYSIFTYDNVQNYSKPSFIEFNNEVEL